MNCFHIACASIKGILHLQLLHLIISPSIACDHDRPPRGIESNIHLFYNPLILGLLSANFFLARADSPLENTSVASRMWNLVASDTSLAFFGQIDSDPAVSLQVLKERKLFHRVSLFVCDLCILLLAGFDSYDLHLRCRAHCVVPYVRWWPSFLFDFCSVLSYRTSIVFNSCCFVSIS